MFDRKWLIVLVLSSRWKFRSPVMMGDPGKIALVKRNEFHSSKQEDTVEPFALDGGGLYMVDKLILFDCMLLMLDKGINI